MKKLVSILLIGVMMIASLTACGGGSQFSDEFAIADVTLVDTNTAHAEAMKGFSMQGTIGELLDNEELFSVGMAFTTGTIEEVQAFFSEEPFTDPASFLAEVDALDIEGQIRNLADDRKSYLDGAADNPIKFYGDAVDLLNKTSLLNTAGEYHFYLVAFGNESVLWVGEADKTFTMTEEDVTKANEIAEISAILVETLLEEGKDVSGLSQDDKTKLVNDYFKAEIGALELGYEINAVYGADEDYPNDYEVTFSKDGAEQMVYVSVYFGEIAE